MIATDPTTSQPSVGLDSCDYISHWTMRDGRRIFIRPIRPEDEPLLAQFHARLSLETVYARYSQVLPLSSRTEHERLAGRCLIDYDQQIALVAVDLDSPEPTMVAVARLTKMDHNDAEFAIVVADSYQHGGLGTKLLGQLVDIARDKALDRVFGYINSDNTAMCTVCSRLGFEVEWPSTGPTRTAVLKL